MAKRGKKLNSFSRREREEGKKRAPVGLFYREEKEKKGGRTMI